MLNEVTIRRCQFLPLCHDMNKVSKVLLDNAMHTKYLCSMPCCFGEDF